MQRVLVAALALATSASLAACTVGDGVRGEDSPGQCRDGVDNDGDALVDCEEADECARYTFCGGSVGVDGGADAGRDAGGPRPYPDAGPRPDGGPPGASCTDPLDVVFVIDVSTSMRDEVDAIRTGIDSIWTAATSLTTGARFGLVVFVDDVVAVNGCAPFEDVAALQSELMRWQAFTSTNRQPGGGGTSNGDCPENSLDALHTAAMQCPWRDGATRVVIHVTDDTFEEAPGRLSGVTVQHTYAETVGALVGREVRAGVFAAAGAGDYCGAGTSANVGRGFHEPFLGMQSIPDATGARAWSIREVRAGTLDMATAITELIEDEYCTLF